MNLVGKVKIIKNGKVLFEKNNAINAMLRTYLYDAMSAPTDKAIDNLFTVNGSLWDGSETTKDGIVVWLNLGERVSSITTLEVSTNTTRMWEGIYTNDLGADKTVEFLVLGHNFNGHDPSFAVNYATIDLVAGSNEVLLQPNDSIIIQWTISITA